MANNENLIPIPGRLHSVATEGHVAGADEIYDDTLQKDQATINSEVQTAIGTGGTVDQKITAAVNALDATKSQTAGADGLALSVTEVDGKITSISGSIAANTYDANGAAATAKTEVIGGATSSGDTLKKLEDRVSPLETAVGSGGSVDSRISSAVNAAKSELKGNATSACDTLGEAEALIAAEATVREAANTALDGRIDTLEDVVDDCAYIGENDGTAVIANFDPQSDTVWKKAQTLSNADKAQVKTNLGLPQEIYSKTEVNELVSTPHQNYVTVATYSELPASGSTDTIYRVSNYDGTQVAAGVYSEYAWNGSDYVFLAAKSSVGEVFDISEYHAGAKYADLAAALGSNGVNIPESLRKGGMSVKFVLNSDNKYVQYMLLKESFSTDGIDWQKQNIDANYLLTDTIAPDWLHYELKVGFYYNGTIEGNNSNWRRCKIDISNASILKFRTNLYGSAANCCITDAEGNVLKTWILADLPSNKFVIFDLSSLTEPKYFYYSVFLNNFTEDDVYIKALADIASLHELKDAKSYATGYEEVESGELSNVLILTNNAPTETATPVYRTTSYLPVSTGDEIKVLSYCGNSAFVITGYSSKSQESYVSAFSVYGKGGITDAEWFNAKIPSGVNYIRVSSSKDYLVNGKIVIKRKVADSIDARLFPIDGRQLVFLNNPYLIDVKGTLVSSGGLNYYCSDFIELDECVSYKLIGIQGGYGCLWVSFYSSQNQEDFIGQAVTGDDGTTARTIVFIVPKGGKYVRFCGSWNVARPQPITLIRANEGYRIAANESKLLPSNRTLLDFPRTASRKPMILFQMDMANVAYSQKIIDYADILEANGVKRSTYNVLPEYLGHDAYTNFDFWMNTLFNRGNEVALHTGPDYNFHLNSTMTDAQVEAAMKDYLDRLEAKGYKITGFIPLGAELKQSFKPIIKKYMNWMLSGDGPTGNVPGDVNLMEDNVMDFISSLQTDRFQILRVDLECTHEDASAEMHAAMLQKAKDVVDETIERGGYTIFYSHTYNKTFGTTYTLYPELFIPLCEYIKNKIDNRQLVTGNTNEMLEWYYTPRIGE